MISEYLAENLRILRESRGFSQAQAARLSGIPRPTWATLETGSGNPTIAVLAKISAALQVPVEELIGAPRSDVQFFPSSEMKATKRGGAYVRRVLPESMKNMELERMEFPPDARFGGVPHRPGTREYLYCESGSIELTASGRSWKLEAGDVLVFRGDQKHSYRNSGRGTSVGFSLVLF